MIEFSSCFISVWGASTPRKQPARAVSHVSLLVYKLFCWIIGLSRMILIMSFRKHAAFCLSWSVLHLTELKQVCFSSLYKAESADSLLTGRPRIPYSKKVLYSCKMPFELPLMVQNGKKPPSSTFEITPISIPVARSSLLAGNWTS